MSRKNKKEINFLEVIPEKTHLNYKVKDGIVHLKFIYNHPVQKFLRWLTKKREFSILELDKMGSFLWENIDGKNTVYDLINILLEKEEDTYESMEKRVITYVRILKNKKLIKFNVK